MSTEADDKVRSRLGARIRVLREARNLTQQELGELVDCSQKYVSQLERGDGSPSWEKLVALAHKGFEIKLASLMFGIDEDIDTELQEVSDLVAGRSLEARRILLESIALAVRAGEIDTRVEPPATDPHGGSRSELRGQPTRAPGKSRAAR